jgi:hypothetical protein
MLEQPRYWHSPAPARLGTVRSQQRPARLAVEEREHLRATALPHQGSQRPQQVRAGVDELVGELIERVSRAADETAAREAYRQGFRRLSSQLDLYPVSGRPASVTFESAAKAARHLAASCLPLGLAVAMHLYPFCVLQCMPLPLLSLARFRRAGLLRTVRKRSLILANAGSDRSRGPHDCLIARQDARGIRVDGTFEYMSLATVADLVFFKARLADSQSTVLCAADLRTDSVRIGSWRFPGSMRLSDTSSVTFDGHLVPHGRYLLVADDDVLRCTSDYQRCWFHLFLSDIYLARLERLHHVRGLPPSSEQVISLNELSRLREYALRLLDEFSPGSDIQPLKDTTSAMKLRVSLMAQSMMAALRHLVELTPTDAEQLRAEASELSYIKSQPTADEIILRSIGVLH